MSGFFLLLPLLVSATDSAKILGIVPTASYSHQILFRPLWIELSRRGHQVTLLTTDTIEDTIYENLTQIDLHSAYNVWQKHDVYKEIHEIGNQPFKFINLFAKIVAETADFELQHPEVQELIYNEEKNFDLVMVEISFLAMFPFKERFNCPMIGLTSMEAPFYLHRLSGNPAHPLLHPERALPFYKKLNLKERIISVAFQIYITLYRRFYILPQHQMIAAKYFFNTTKSLEELEQSFALIFTNVNPIFQSGRPLSAKTINFGGGVHLKSDSSQLPPDLKSFLDQSINGCVYISLGSNVKSVFLKNETKTVMLECFKELHQYKFLWKFEENLLGLPENVKIVKWAPQQEILAHRNVKLFVTQGGLQSLEEAINNHIPMVALPFFGDQKSNSLKMQDKGMGVTLDYQNLKKSDFKSAILEILSNRKYKERVKKLAEFSRDQPMNGLEKLVWWTEFVLRHGEILSENSDDIPAYQYYFLDVISAAVMLLFVLSVALKRFKNMCCRLVLYLSVAKNKKSD